VSVTANCKYNQTTNHSRSDGDDDVTVEFFRKYSISVTDNIAGHNNVRRGKVVAHANEPLAASLEIVALGRDNGEKLDAQASSCRMAVKMVCAAQGKCGGSGVTHLINSKEKK
jgi:hypothetical protein